MPVVFFPVDVVLTGASTVFVDADGLVDTFGAGAGFGAVVVVLFEGVLVTERDEELDDLDPDDRPLLPFASAIAGTNREAMRMIARYFIGEKNYGLVSLPPSTRWFSVWNVIVPLTT